MSTHACVCFDGTKHETPREYVEVCMKCMSDLIARVKALEQVLELRDRPA